MSIESPRCAIGLRPTILFARIFFEDGLRLRVLPSPCPCMDDSPSINCRIARVAGCCMAAYRTVSRRDAGCCIVAYRAVSRRVAACRGVAESRGG